MSPPPIQGQSLVSCPHPTVPGQSRGSYLSVSLFCGQSPGSTTIQSAGSSHFWPPVLLHQWPSWTHKLLHGVHCWTFLGQNLFPLLSSPAFHSQVRNKKSGWWPDAHSSRDLRAIISRPLLKLWQGFPCWSRGSQDPAAALPESRFWAPGPGVGCSWTGAGTVEGVSWGQEGSAHHD